MRGGRKEEEEIRGARGGVGGGVKERRESRNNETRRMGSLTWSREGEEGRRMLSHPLTVNKDLFSDECEDERQKQRGASDFNSDVFACLATLLRFFPASSAWRKFKGRETGGTGGRCTSSRFARCASVTLAGAVFTAVFHTVRQGLEAGLRLGSWRWQIVLDSRLGSKQSVKIIDDEILQKPFPGSQRRGVQTMNNQKHKTTKSTASR